MFKLMKLELRKRNKNMMNTLIWNWLLVTGIVLFFVGMIILTSKSDSMGELHQDMSELLDKMSVKVLVDTMVGVSFMIYAGVNYARFVVKDFSNNSLEQLFTYPLSRTKILYSKIVLAASITASGMILTKFIAYAFTALLGYGFNMRLINVAEVLTSSVAIALLAQIAMAVGMWKKSSIATIVAAFLLATLTQGNIGAIQLSEFPIITYLGAIVGVLTCVVFVRKMNDYEFFN